MLSVRFYGALTGFGLPWLALAGEAEGRKPLTGLITSADVWQWLLSLFVVLVLFVGFAWLLRRTGNLSLASRGQLAVISGLSLGVREKLVLVKVGDKQLLLGVTPNRIDKLLELEGDARLFQGGQDKDGPDSFAQKLQQILQGNPHA